MKARYVGLLGGRIIAVVADSTGLLIKPAIAARQLAVETPSGPTVANSQTGTPAVGVAHGATDGTVIVSKSSAAPPKPKRFHATVRLDPCRIGRDAGRIAEEVVQHLALLPDTKVDVVMEIQAEIPDGAPDSVVRTVTENCRTLKFKSQGFEKD